MCQSIEVQVKPMTRIGQADDGRIPFYSVTELGRDLSVTARTNRFEEDKGLTAPRRAGNNHAKQLRILARQMRRRILLLEKQRVALNRTLAKFRRVESQAAVALARLAKTEHGGGLMDTASACGAGPLPGAHS
jgi:hypothetical protein